MYSPAFGLSIAPWVFSKVMREMVMLWRRESISVLPYLDEFMFMKQDFLACVRLARRVEEDLVRTGMEISVPKCRMISAKQRRLLGFLVYFVAGRFQFPSDRWEALKVSVDSILTAR